jgi:hypothetical protein
MMVVVGMIMMMMMMMMMITRMMLRWLSRRRGYYLKARVVRKSGHCGKDSSCSPGPEQPLPLILAPCQPPDQPTGRLLRITKKLVLAQVMVGQDDVMPNVARSRTICGSLPLGP